MTLNNLYQIAENENIIVTSNKCNFTKSVVLNAYDNWIIDLNFNRIHTQTEEKMCLTHELAHYFTGAVYCDETSGINRSKCEYRANKWTVQVLIPYESMKTAIENGYTEIWELAEYFEVPEDLIHKAIYLYQL